MHFAAARQGGFGIDAKLAQDSLKDGRVTDFLTTPKLRFEHGGGEWPDPRLCLPRIRHPSRRQAVCREGLGHDKVQATCLGYALHIPHHVSALGRKQVEGARVPSLRFEDRSQQNRSP
jgi:hypothetical protein